MSPVVRQRYAVQHHFCVSSRNTWNYRISVKLIAYANASPTFSFLFLCFAPDSGSTIQTTSSTYHFTTSVTYCANLLPLSPSPAPVNDDLNSNHAPKASHSSAQPLNFILIALQTTSEHVTFGLNLNESQWCRWKFINDGEHRFKCSRPKGFTRFPRDMTIPRRLICSDQIELSAKLFWSMTTTTKGQAFSFRPPPPKITQPRSHAIMWNCYGSAGDK